MKQPRISDPELLKSASWRLYVAKRFLETAKRLHADVITGQNYEIDPDEAWDLGALVCMFRGKHKGSEDEVLGAFVNGYVCRSINEDPGTVEALADAIPQSVLRELITDSDAPHGGR